MLKQVISLILPVTAIILVPYWITLGVGLDIPDLFSFLSGAFIMIAGITILFFTIRMLILIGRGTLAPWSPTSKLVISGVYAHTRNPMIFGVFITLLGEALLFRSPQIYLWALTFFIINTIYFRFSEEPGLEKRFGSEYVKYKNNVPRWIPRMTPWRP